MFCLTHIQHGPGVRPRQVGAGVVQQLLNLLLTAEVLGAHRGVDGQVREHEHPDEEKRSAKLYPPAELVRVCVLLGLQEEVIDHLGARPAPTADSLAVEEGGQRGRRRVHRRCGFAEYIILSVVRFPEICLQTTLVIIIGKRNFSEFFSPQFPSSLDDNGWR